MQRSTILKAVLGCIPQIWTYPPMQYCITPTLQTPCTRNTVSHSRSAVSTMSCLPPRAGGTSRAVSACTSMATASGRGESAAGEEESSAMCRLRRLSLHLLQPFAPGPSPSPSHPTLALASCAGRARRVEGGADVAAALAAYLCGRNRATQMRLFDFFRQRPDLHTLVELATTAHRELCYHQLRALVHEAGVRPLTLMANEPAEYFAVMKGAGGANISPGVKLAACC